jgi:hypothetical protein
VRHSVHQMSKRETRKLKLEKNGDSLGPVLQTNLQV